MVFCTLFDSNYLDKGLTLYSSLEKVLNDFRLYILAMDEKCFEVLNDLNYSHIVPIEINKFSQSEGLNELRKERSQTEFCWTCTAYLIDYVLTSYKEEICTYIDADMYFYSNPQCLLDEMGGKSVQIIEHRFTNSIKDRISQKESGRFCVEFNTFRNDESARELLQWWKSKCYESCSAKSEDQNVFGDQKYLESWANHPNVSVVSNLGAGVAPWNVAQYKLSSGSNDKLPIVLKHKKENKKMELIFYHYHNITYTNKHEVNINVYQRAWGIDDNLIKELYIPYLKEIDQIKGLLSETYGIKTLIQIHPSFVGRMKKKQKDVHDIYKYIINKSIKDMYILLYLNINSKLRRLFKEKKNIISLKER